MDPCSVTWDLPHPCDSNGHGGVDHEIAYPLMGELFFSFFIIMILR